MRRPVLFITAALVVGISIEYALMPGKLFIWAACVISFVLLLIRRTKRDALIYSFLISILLSILFFNLINSEEHLSEFYNKEITLEGYVVGATEVNDYFQRVVIKTEKIIFEHRDIPVKEKVIINLSGQVEKPYEWIGHKLCVSGILQMPPGSRNPKTFDYRLYLKTKNIHSMMDTTVDQIQLYGEYKKVIHALSAVKYSFVEKIGLVMKEEAGVLTGILFGDKSYLDSNIYENFQRNGTAHILAVSGIHIGVLYSVLEFLLRKSHGTVKDFFVIAFLILYAAVSGFSPSVIRAVMMIVLFIISKRVHKRYDLISAAGFTALIILLLNPYMLFNVGFQLSFVAVFSIGMIYPYLQKRVKYKNAVINMFLLLLTLQIGTAPLIAYHFNYFSIAAFFINIPVILLAGMILPLGFLLFAVSFINAEIFKWMAVAESALLNFMIFINQEVSVIIKDAVHVISPPTAFLILLYVIICFMTSEMLPSAVEKYKKMISITGVVLLIFLLIFKPTVNCQYEIVFLDVGQGDCIHIKAPGGRNILIDGGGSPEGNSYDVGKKVILPYLLKNGVKQIDLAIITHLHADHYKGIVSVMEEIKVNKTAMYKESSEPGVKELIVKSCKNNNSVITYLKKNDKINIQKDIFFKVLHPEEGYNNKEENNNSLVLLLDYQGHKILFTGDIEEEAEYVLVKGNIDLQSRVLKVPHHGSKTSSTEDLIEKVNPEAAVISVGNNSFGHPAQEVINRYKDEGVRVFRTDKDGAVLIDIQKKHIFIKTMMEGERYEL